MQSDWEPLVSGRKERCIPIFLSRPFRLALPSVVQHPRLQRMLKVQVGSHSFRLVPELLKKSGTLSPIFGIFLDKHARDKKWSSLNPTKKFNKYILSVNYIIK